MICVISCYGLNLNKELCRTKSDCVVLYNKTQQNTTNVAQQTYLIVTPAVLDLLAGGLSMFSGK